MSDREELEEISTKLAHRYASRATYDIGKRATSVALGLEPKKNKRKLINRENGMHRALSRLRFQEGREMNENYKIHSVTSDFDTNTFSSHKNVAFSHDGEHYLAKVVRGSIHSVQDNRGNSAMKKTRHLHDAIRAAAADKRMHETVYPPVGGDERRFLAKHRVTKKKYPADTRVSDTLDEPLQPAFQIARGSDEQWPIADRNGHSKRYADYTDGEDEIVYEQVLNEISKALVARYKEAARDSLSTSERMHGAHQHVADVYGRDVNKKHAKKFEKVIQKRLSGLERATQKEETQLDEISKALAARYVVKNQASTERLAGRSALVGTKERETHKLLDRKLDNRYHGIRNAVKRLTREETRLDEATQLDEISNKLLKNYVDKALKRADHHTAEIRAAHKREDLASANGQRSKVLKARADAEKHITQRDKREQGVKQAEDRLHYGYPRRPKAAGVHEETHLDEAMQLNKVNQVYHDDHSREFAKHYVNAEKGNYNNNVDPEKHDKYSEFFHQNYELVDHKTGFAGTGRSTYRHRKTGEHYQVSVRANGKTFHGNDHHITKVSP